MKRKAFTLTELMVSIVIISILASVTLYAMASVQTQAKVQKAKAQISKIHELITERWESYEERIVDVSIPSGYSRPVVRLFALRELQKMELPDRVTDVLALGPYTGNVDANVPTMNEPTLRRYYHQFAESRSTNWTTSHQGAECLYMILSRIEVADASALEMFSDTEIGDTDNDGMPEILDPWGHAIQWVRWAPGFASPIQPGDVDGDGVVSAASYSLATPDHVRSRDVLDYARVDPRTLDSDNDEAWSQTFALFPLIFSNGPDGNANIIRDILFTDGTVLTYSLTDKGSRYNPDWGGPGRGISIPNDPFVFADHGDWPTPVQLGNLKDSNSDGHVDNIYNHFIETSIN